MSNIMCACGNDVEYPTCAECEDKEVAALRARNETLTKALRDCIGAMRFVAACDPGCPTPGHAQIHAAITQAEEALR